MPTTPQSTTHDSDTGYTPSERRVTVNAIPEMETETYATTDAGEDADGLEPETGSDDSRAFARTPAPASPEDDAIPGEEAPAWGDDGEEPATSEEPSREAARGVQPDERAEAPETAEEPKPETALEAKPETAPDPKPESTPESKPESAPEPKPESTPEPKPETTPETAPEPAPDTGEKAEPEPCPPAAEPAPAPAPEPCPPTAPEPQPAPEQRAGDAALLSGQSTSASGSSSSSRIRARNSRSVGAVEDAVVAGERHLHAMAHGHPTVDDHRRLRHRPDGEDRRPAAG